MSFEGEQWGYQFENLDDKFEFVNRRRAQMYDIILNSTEKLKFYLGTFQSPCLVAYNLVLLLKIIYTFIHTMDDGIGTSGREGTRRSSRAVHKPDFRAMENYGNLQDSEDVFLFDSEDNGMEKKGSSRASGSRSVLGRQHKPSAKAKAGAKSRRPAALDDMESIAKKLEDDIATLQDNVDTQRRTYEALCQENQVLMKQIQELQNS